MLVKRKKNTVRAAKLQCKSAQYLVEQNSINNYLVNQELINYSFA